MVTFFCNELNAHAGSTCNLAATAWFELHIVNDGTEGNGPQRQRVSCSNFGVLTVLQHVSDFHIARRKDVALLTVVVVEQSDARSAVGVVFDRGYLRQNAVFHSL